MTTEVLLVRHGVAARVGDAVERTDPGLSELGRAQVSALADAVAAEGIHAVHSSPQRRALETARIVANPLGLTVHQNAGLAEFDFGAGDYLFFEELRDAEDPRYFACMSGDLSGWGTDAATFRKRVHTTVGELAAAHRGERILLSTHGGALNALFGAILDLQPFWFFAPHNGGISRLNVDPRGRMQVVSLNEAGHLRAAGVVGS